MTLDIRISTGLPNHPKTKKLRRRLGNDGAWALICLLVFARVERPDGQLDGMSDEDIELAADWCGEPGELVLALLAVRFLAGEEGARRIHDWSDHNPWSAGAKSRSSRAKFAVLTRDYGRDRAIAMMREIDPEYVASLPGEKQQRADLADASPMNYSDLIDRESSSPSPSPSPSPIQSPVGKVPASVEGGAVVVLPRPSGRAASPAGLACRAMRDAGVAQVNPSHPELLALLDAGAPPDEFADTAAECVANGKSSFAYVLKTMRGRRAEAASREPVATGPPTARVLPGKTVMAYTAMEKRRRDLERQANEEESGSPRLVSGPD